MIARLAVRLSTGAALLVLVSGCFGQSLPSQGNPTCSWAGSPPDNANALCRTVFSTLKSVVRAEQEGDDAAIHRLVPNGAVARRITAYGRSLRAQGASGLHVVPSLTLDLVRSGQVGAGFYILGTSRQGRINAPQTVYLHVERGKALIVADQPGQNW